jgi:hypothetical protein
MLPLFAALVESLKILDPIRGLGIRESLDNLMPADFFARWGGCTRIRTLDLLTFSHLVSPSSHVGGQ